MERFEWTDFSRKIKAHYMKIAPNMWWGDDLDVRFYLLKQLSDIKNKRILDVGCNIGIIISFLDKSNDTYGIDINEECVCKAGEQNPGSHITHGSMDDLKEYEDGFFDVIVMSNVLPGYDFGLQGDEEDFIHRTFREIYRVLSDCGIIYLTTPNGKSIHYRHSHKVDYDSLKKHIDEEDLTGTIQGWNSIAPICPRWIANSKLKNRYKFIPPKILCRFNFVWDRLVWNMDRNILESKYFYVELHKQRKGL